MKQYQKRFTFEADSLEEIIEKVNDFLKDKSPGQIFDVYTGERLLGAEEEAFEDVTKQCKRKVIKYNYKYFANILLLIEEP